MSRRVAHAVLALESYAELGEGPVWDAVEQVLWWVDIPHGRVHRFDPSHTQDQSFEVGGAVSSVALTKAGGLVMAAGRRFLTCDSRGEGLVVVADCKVDISEVRLNDGKVDPLGSFWAGTAAHDEVTPAGAVFRLRPDFRLDVMFDQVVCSNGLDWSTDGRWFYYIDSGRRAVDRFRCDWETGGLSDRETLFVVDGPGIPDGMAMDADDGMWIAMFGGGAVRRYRMDGMIDREVTVPTPNVTSLAFGGGNLDEIYITTAREGVVGPQRARDLGGGCLYWASVGIRGRESYRFG